MVSGVLLSVVPADKGQCHGYNNGPQTFDEPRVNQLSHSSVWNNISKENHKTLLLHPLAISYEIDLVNPHAHTRNCVALPRQHKHHAAVFGLGHNETHVVGRVEVWKGHVHPTTGRNLHPRKGNPSFSNLLGRRAMNAKNPSTCDYVN
jgi:hypothetical protein